jgi:hypothetical protein
MQGHCGELGESVGRWRSVSAPDGAGGDLREESHRPANRRTRTPRLHDLRLGATPQCQWRAQQRMCPLQTRSRLPRAYQRVIITVQGINRDRLFSRRLGHAQLLWCRQAAAHTQVRPLSYLWNGRLTAATRRTAPDYPATCKSHLANSLQSSTNPVPPSASRLSRL